MISSGSILLRLGLALGSRSSRWESSTSAVIGNPAHSHNRAGIWDTVSKNTPKLSNIILFLPYIIKQCGYFVLTHLVLVLTPAAHPKVFKSVPILVSRY